MLESKNILIIGGTSDMAQAIARLLAKKGYNLTLTARKKENLASFCSDLQIRHQIKCNALELDVNHFESHPSFYNNLPQKPYGVILAAGYLDNQEKSESDWVECLTSINTNFTGLVSLTNIIANDMDGKEGFIAGISSVAADRGRASNYIYGSAKAGFSTYLDGLRNRFGKTKLHVLNIKPGFVATKMTAHLDLPKPLTASPEQVAKDVVKAIEKKKNTIYTKWIWRYVMLIIKNIPEFIFKKLKI